MQYDYVVNDFHKLTHMQNYKKNEEKIIELIGQLLVFVHLKYKVYNFEYGYKDNTEWFAISLSEEPDEKDDLVIAFDLYTDDTSQLRIHYPHCLGELVYNYFGSNDYNTLNRFFEKEDDYLDEIKNIMLVI
jgi:hypothetical protein